MTLEQMQQWHEYYKTLGFDTLAATFNEICQEFLSYQTEIRTLREQLAKTENELANAKQLLEEKEKGEQENEEDLSAGNAAE